MLYCRQGNVTMTTQRHSNDKHHIVPENNKVNKALLGGSFFIKWLMYDLNSYNK
jgi:hypothetical protein